MARADFLPLSGTLTHVHRVVYVGTGRGLATTSHCTVLSTLLRPRSRALITHPIPTYNPKALVRRLVSRSGTLAQCVRALMAIACCVM